MDFSRSNSGILTSVTLILMMEYNEVFNLCLDDNCWSEEVPTGDIPQATSSTMVTTDDGRIIMFGGVLKGTACNDVHILNASM